MVDLRSDTLTLPDRAMLETILTAKLGDDGRVGETGRGEDPTVNALEDLAAKLTGKEAALLFPTGTMGNSCGVLSWVKSGAKVLVHEQQHLLLTEKFLFDNAFCRMQPIKYKFTETNIPDLKNIEDLLISSQSKLICLENTHNFSGGYVIPVEEMKKIHLLAERYGAHIHMDGARLGYGLAAYSTDVTLKDIARLCDVFYIGGTKVGALFGEAVVVTRTDLLPHFLPLVKQHGALLAKGRLLGVQFETLFSEDLYLRISPEDMARSSLIQWISSRPIFRQLRESPLWVCPSPTYIRFDTTSVAITKRLSLCPPIFRPLRWPIV